MGWWCGGKSAACRAAGGYGGGAAGTAPAGAGYGGSFGANNQFPQQQQQTAPYRAPTQPQTMPYRSGASPAPAAAGGYVQGGVWQMVLHGVHPSGKLLFFTCDRPALHVSCIA